MISPTIKPNDHYRHHHQPWSPSSSPPYTSIDENLFSSKRGKPNKNQMKIRPCLSFLGMTGSGDLLKFRFSKSSYSLSSKMGQDGQETPVTTRGKTGFIFLFSSLQQEKTLFATICICICVTPLARKKAICISIWM